MPGASVNMFWQGGALSPLERLAMVSFMANGHPVDLYSYDGIDNVPDGVTLLDANMILPEREAAIPVGGQPMRKWTFFSDLFRYKLLVEKGGIWCDTDLVCLRPLAFAEGMTQFFAAERVPPKPGSNRPPEFTAASCIIMLPPGSELARQCFERARRIDPTQTSWGAAGPQLLSEVVHSMGLVGAVLPPEVFCPVDWWNFHQLFTGFAALPENCHGVHFWNDMWRRNFVDKHRCYEPLSLYERLRRHHHVD